MKYSLTLVLTLAVLAVGQDGIAALTPCARTCFSRSVATAFDTGLCAVITDGACLCSKADFINSLRDCSIEACGAEESAKLLQYGSQFCSGQVELNPPLSSLPATTSSTLSTLTSSRTFTSSSTSTVVSVITPQSSPASGTTAQTQSTQTSQASQNAGTTRQSSSLSSGAKAGIGAGIAATALIALVIAYILWRRRKHKRASGDIYVIPEKEDGIPDKPELPGTEVGPDSRFALARKPEMPSHGSHGAAYVEMEHREGDDGTSEAPTIPLPPSRTTSPPPGPSTSAGPVPSAFDLLPTLGATSPAAVAEETDFEKQARRLRERRAMIAEQKRAAEEEQEQIDMEEKALQRRRAGESLKTA